MSNWNLFPKSIFNFWISQFFSFKFNFIYLLLFSFSKIQSLYPNTLFCHRQYQESRAQQPLNSISSSIPHQFIVIYSSYSKLKHSPFNRTHQLIILNSSSIHFLHRQHRPFIIISGLSSSSKICRLILI